ncbi:MAG: alkaline phosphatase family protein [Clostridia bacterium]|nr:alkaline phosphatase family protein [Clostridia bacterium]
MENKVILISIDGMRPDGLMGCGNPYIQKLLSESSYTLSASTVFPSVTLPCHMSMFHSVRPERHGTTTNTYMPQVRPIAGIFEALKQYGRTCCMYYGWEPLRNIGRPGSLVTSRYISAYSEAHVDGLLTDAAFEYISAKKPDFCFLYLVDTDEIGGHDNGWMTDAYLGCISYAIDCAKRMIEAFGDEYTVIITADHGGHDRSHGTDSPEDMTIPMIFRGKRFTPARELDGVSILDIAPTVADIIGVPPAREWEGRSLANKE